MNEFGISFLIWENHKYYEYSLILLLPGKNRNNQFNGIESQGNKYAILVIA